MTASPFRCGRHVLGSLILGLVVLPTHGHAQASGFDHTCADCHMRDHATAVGGAAPNEARLTVLAITKLVPGLSVQSATCLECHSTPEQRRRRAEEGSEGPGIPMAGGLYVGFTSLDRHPLGRERRSITRGGTAGRSSPFAITWTEPGMRADQRTRPGEGVECAACHSVHAYDLRVSSTADERTVCLSCHDPTYYAFNAHITPTCGDCHQQHNAPGPSLTREMDTDALCAACHEGSGRMALNRIDPSLQGPPTHIDLRPGRCSDCHKIHGDPGGG